MAGARAKINPLDHVRPAGKMSMGKDESVAYCMAFPERPPTPEHVKPYRHTADPGAKSLHFGMKDLHLAENAVFGSVDKSAATGAHLILDQRKPVMTEYIEKRAEENFYKSVKQAPLGKSSLPGRVQVPVRLTATSTASGPNAGVTGAAAPFAFGRPSGGPAGPVRADGMATKMSIFPNPPPAGDAEKEAALYTKSHGSYAPGVRKNCPIEWEKVGISPDNFTFGRKSGRTPAGAILPEEARKPVKVTAGTADTVGALINPTTNEALSQSRIVPKSVDDFRVVTSDRVGQQRGHGLTDTSKFPVVFGKPSRTKRDAGDWSAGDCIRGDYTTEEQQPDLDLGRSSRNLKRPGVAEAAVSVPDPDRRFGVPSIRSDVPPRPNVSIASTADFGAGTGAAQLLSPSPYAEHGIDDEDFVIPRSEHQLRDIFGRIGYRFSEEEFAKIFEHACYAYALTPPGYCSVEEMRRAIDEVEEARSNGETADFML